MLEQSLDGNWFFRQAGSENWLPASVPGGVHLDLMAAGMIPDPFPGDNERSVQWVAECDWEYRRTFLVESEVMGQEQVFLVCDGLDTLGDVRLNGTVLGKADNMFRQWRWNATGLLRPGENQLEIYFHSPVHYVQRKMAERPLPGTIEWIPGGQYLRKAQSHFGWDWGPHLPEIGIWKNIRLEAGRIARLDDVRLRQQHEDGRVVLSASVTAEIWLEDLLTAYLRVTAPDGTVQETFGQLADGTVDLSININDPELWWPNGYGLQPLYRVEVMLMSGERQLDYKAYQVGLRTVTLRRQPDEWGESFYFIVNGVPIFAKGSNWIPSDSFPTRTTRPQLEHLILSAAATHQNMLRVWGGGMYESEYFFDLCDHYGIMIWHDFMFACSVYPLDDPEFMENVRREVIENVRRIRHRACLALWCGNNEMDVGWAGWGWYRPDTIDLREADQQFFHYQLSKWVAELDPDHDYWPSSPTSGTPPVSPNGGMSGDIHQWDVWHGLKPFSNYKQTPARFVSEFGFQSLPAIPTVMAYAPRSEWNMTSYIMEYHQRSPHGNGKIITYMTEHFRLPKDFDSLVYLTQTLQAEAMRIGVEHWRRERARTGGTLYWQLNDCWPVASWSSIDYFGRWKATQYAARRFYAPQHLSIDDTTQILEVFVTNDTVLPWNGEVRWTLESIRGEVLQSGGQAVSGGPLATTHVLSIDLGKEAEAPRRDVALVCEFWQDGEMKERAVNPLVPDKHLILADPGFQVEPRKDGPYLFLSIRAATLARFVEISIAGLDEIFSDNYFDLPANHITLVSVPLPQGWTVDRAMRALRLRSLYDSYISE